MAADDVGAVVNDLQQRCLRDQTAELMLLNSMYKVPEELQFSTTDGYSKLPLDEFLVDPASCLYHVDEFSLKMKDALVDVPAELTFRLPPNYPHLEPLSVYVRSSALDSESSRLINVALRQHLHETFTPGEPQIMDAISWFRDHVDEFQCKTSTPSSCTAVSPRRSSSSPPQFERIWFYSHHIYSKFKRKDIVSLAGQLNLTGFSMPGKPGVVCVEGFREDTQEFWDIIRTWTWKKIVVKHQETTDLNCGDGKDDVEKKVGSLRKFGPLKEVGFDVRHGGGREFHMDMAGFHKYLIDHECGHLFQILFGLNSGSECPSTAP